MLEESAEEVNAVALDTVRERAGEAESCFLHLVQETQSVSDFRDEYRAVGRPVALGSA